MLESVECRSGGVALHTRMGVSEGEELVDVLAEGLDLLRAGETEVLDLLAVLEEEDRGDGHYAALGAEVALFLDVVFADDNTAVVFFSEFVDGGTHAYTGAAPCCPEVDDDGLT